MSLHVRKRIELSIGWVKTIRGSRKVGLDAARG